MNQKLHSIIENLYLMHIHGDSGELPRLIIFIIILSTILFSLLFLFKNISTKK
jgi:hypothetical protein